MAIFTDLLKNINIVRKNAAIFGVIEGGIRNYHRPLKGYYAVNSSKEKCSKIVLHSL
jgi:hypothetical protein